MRTLYKFIAASAIIALIGGMLVVYISQDTGETLTLATTTSVDNTGLLDMLIAKFTEQNPKVTVKVVAKGTGAAIALARDGGADALIVHAPDKELEFVDEGYGVNRTTLWYNYFLLVGGDGDPLGLGAETNITAAFSKLYDSADVSHPFVSRGDNSGTHIKEMSIWSETGLNVSTQLPWYKESGAGMSSTLRTTAELKGYTLSDRGTFLFLRDSLSLTPVYQKEDPLLYNPYSFIAVSPDKYPDTHYTLAMKFLKFLEDSVELVQNFTISGEQMFIPINSG